MSARPGPQHVLSPREGDLVVAPDRWPARRFTVRQHPSDPQLCAASRDDAIRQARAFAQHYSVDVWFCDDRDCRLLESYRARPVARAARRAAGAA